jgi:hypothetical protein
MRPKEVAMSDLDGPPPQDDLDVDNLDTAADKDSEKSVTPKTVAGYCEESEREKTI